MKAFKFLMPLALLCSAFTFQTAQAAKVAVVHDKIGVPFTRSYISEQRVKQVHATQGFSNVDVMLVIPDDYPNWEFRFYNPIGDQTIATYTTTGNYVDYDTPIVTLPEGNYNIDITCDDYNPLPFWIYFYWWFTPDNLNYDYGYKMSGNSNAFNGPVTLRDVTVTEPNSSYPTQINIAKI